jgi:hypothetical protein
LPDRARVPGRTSLPAIVAWTLLVGLSSAGLLSIVDAGPAVAGAPSRQEQVRFMWAMAGQESGWDYYARNASSGAFGKYQIMPFNWPVWAAQYLADGRADQTPWNQEKVAYGKLRDLYGWLGSWKRVAYWWLTGRTDRSEKRWSGYARAYVHNIMQLRRQAPPGAGKMPVRTSSRSERGDWRRTAVDQRLRLDPGGKPWRRGGLVRDGQVVWVHRAATRGVRIRWIAVTTQDGRFGWLPQARSLPAERPPRGRAWRDIRDRGGASEASDRRLVRPRPR